MNGVDDHDGQLVGRSRSSDGGDARARCPGSSTPAPAARGYATRAVRLLADYAIDRPQAWPGSRPEVDPENDAPLRVATRAGLHREGVHAGPPGQRRPSRDRGVRRLRPAAPPTRPSASRGLPGAAQLVPPPQARDRADARARHEGRVLLCQLTYKSDWDLPGGVVEVGESPQLAVGPRGRRGARPRHAGRRAAAHRLAAAVERLGRRALPGLRRRRPRRLGAEVVRPGAGDPRRQFCTPPRSREHCADFTARRIERRWPSTARDRRRRPAAEYVSSVSGPRPPSLRRLAVRTARRRAPGGP